MLAVQPRKQKHHFSQIPFYIYIIEVFKSQHILKSSVHPMIQCLRGLSYRHYCMFRLNSSAVIQAKNLSFGILCPSPSICVTMGTGKPITVHRDEPQESKGTQICSTTTTTSNKTNIAKGKKIHSHQWDIILYDIFLLREAENLYAVRSKEKLKQRSAAFPTPPCHIEHILHIVSFVYFSPLLQYYGK